MCWTVHFKKCFGWNRRCSLFLSCRISYQTNKLVLGLEIYQHGSNHILSADCDVFPAPQSVDWKCVLRRAAAPLYQIEMKCHSNSQQLGLTTPSAVTGDATVLLWLWRKHRVMGMQRSKSPDRMWSSAWKSTEWTRQCSVRPADGRWGEDASSFVSVLIGPVKKDSSCEKYAVCSCSFCHKYSFCLETVSL